MTMKRIGIFGGSFDPVHIGHISLAKDALNQCQLEKVILIPAKTQPFKAGKKVTPAADRMAMVSLAIEDEPHLELSDYEVHSGEVSYTYLTMREMRLLYPGDELFFITGTDSFLMIEKWRESEELLKNYSFIIGSRPGYRDDELDECMEDLQRRYGTKAVKIHNTKIDISSTDVRKMAGEGKSLENLVPESVADYIRERHLYLEHDDELLSDKTRS